MFEKYRDGDSWRVSASLLSIFSECTARAYVRMLGVSTPQTAAQERGTLIHDKIDAYYKTGAASAKIAKLAPIPRSPAVLSEYYFKVRLTERTVVSGLIDVWKPSAKVFCDHKTTKVIKPAKLDDYLRSLQFQLYAYVTRSTVAMVNGIDLELCNCVKSRRINPEYEFAEYVRPVVWDFESWADGGMPLEVRETKWCKWCPFYTWCTVNQNTGRVDLDQKKIIAVYGKLKETADE